ncbi:hypothetical protein MMC25_000457, partial [Agyrium rufum]|nr:hypothetical protein [Agyrium rufum]
MVRGFGLSRSRSTRIRDNDISAQAEAISQPLLLATDAAPRGDLRVLQRSVTANGAVHSSRPWLEIEDSQRPARAKSPTYPPAGFGQHTNPRFE